MGLHAASSDSGWPSGKRRPVFYHPVWGGEGRQWAILSGIHDILRPCLRGMPDIWWSVAWRVIYRSVLHVGVVGRRKRCRGDGQNSEALETHM
jgi:hypothetical protein